MNRIPVIIFLGAPGAGKGTQALHLSNAKRIPRISTGDMLRQAVHEDSELGQKVKAIMNEGRLVDDETMLKLMEERISRPDCKNGFIMDGYPRNMKQAASFERILQPHMNLWVIKIEVAEEDIVKRIAGRRTCPKCERIYNIYFHPAGKDEICDADQTPLFRRDDDHEEVVRRRIETYQRETSPLIDYYRKKEVLQLVNGSQLANLVADQIRQAVGLN